MTAQPRSQTSSNTQHRLIGGVARVSCALALLIAGLLATRSITGAHPIALSSGPHAAGAGRSTTVPALWSTGSAYDGGDYRRAQTRGSAFGSPIRHAVSSAYDGGTYGRVLDIAPGGTRDVPALHATGSAYDGQ